MILDFADREVQEAKTDYQFIQRYHFKILCYKYQI